MADEPESSSSSPLDLVVLFCPRAIRDQGERLESLARGITNLRVRSVRIACTSAVQIPDLLSMLETGAAAVFVVACPENKCQFLAGGTRAERRVEHARRLLEQIGMEGERLEVLRGEHNRAEDLIALLVDRARVVRALGPPLKKKLKEEK